jgi:nucleotide-binding universal stress UspA family protein
MTSDGPRWPKRILVGSDGSTCADAALGAACFLARRTCAAVTVLAVFAPRIPLPAAARRNGITECEAGDRRAAARLLLDVRRQRTRRTELGCAGVDWTIQPEVGDPGLTLVRIAQEHDADIVVVGMRQAEPVNRWLGRTIRNASRFLRVPLFAAASPFTPPRRVVVALPEGRSEEPIRVALDCIEPNGKLWIAAPVSRDFDGAALTAATARGAVIAAARAETTVSETLTVHAAPIGETDPLAGVLRIATEISADLIVAPNYGDPGPVRAFLPNLAEPLLLAARTSVLVVPVGAHPSP